MQKPQIAKITHPKQPTERIRREHYSINTVPGGYIIEMNVILERDFL